MNFKRFTNIRIQRGRQLFTFWRACLVHRGFISTIQDSLTEELDMNLGQVVAKLQSYAPTKLASSWDNVGLLIEPSPPHVVTKMLVTNDLTREVLDEALAKKVNLILSYHPPLFTPIKTINQSSWKQRIAVKCLENRIAVYSPHTSFDAQKCCINDWLIAPFGVGQPIEKAYLEKDMCKVELSIANTEVADLKQKLVTSKLCQSDQISVKASGDGSHDSVLSFTSPQRKISCITSFVHSFPEKTLSLQITPLCDVPSKDLGAGRLLKLDTKITLGDAVDRVKTHLKLPHVRLARAVNNTLDSSVGSVAVCAGSGSSVLSGVSADLYITGEMSHHEVLDAIHNKRSVILCEHSNTERGFLRDVACGELADLLEGQVEVTMSDKDSDPLQVL